MRIPSKVEVSVWSPVPERSHARSKQVFVTAEFKSKVSGTRLSNTRCGTALRLQMAKTVSKRQKTIEA